MVGSTTLVIVIVAVVAGLAGLWIYLRRSARPKGRGHEKVAPKNQAEQWGVRIATPAKERACPQVRDLLGKEFHVAQRPSLPVPDCPFSHECQCFYVKLFDRRRHERRSNQDRRQAQRFDTDSVPRRAGKDRRKGQVEWAEPDRD
jgi:uncharacterized membrane protein